MSASESTGKRPAVVVRPAGRDGVPNDATGGDVYSRLAGGSQTDGSFFLTHAVVPPEGGPPPHIHTREEEAFFVIRGEVTFRADGEEIVAGSGTFLNVPKGSKHQFHNSSDQEAEMIFWFAPAGIEGLFEELDAHPEDITAIGEKYGVTYFLDE